MTPHERFESAPAGSPVVCVDGRFLSAAAATVPALDSGFLYGDGVFETFLVLDSGAPFLGRHLARLRAAAGALAIVLPPALDSEESVAALVARLARENGLERGAAGCRVTVSRGPRPPGPLAPAAAAPTLVAALFPVAPPETEPEPVRVGVSTEIVFSAGPWTRHKTLSSLFRILGRAEAHRRGLDDVVFADAESRLCEATNSHLFVLLPGDGWVTPPLSLGILRGLTREGLLAARGRTAAERPVSASDLARARGACLTNSLRGVVPIASFDGRALDPLASRPLRRAWIEAVAGRAGARPAEGGP